MTFSEYGNTDAPAVLIQAVDEHDMALIAEEADMLGSMCPSGFCLIAVTVDDWLCDLSPWSAPPVYGRKPFGNGALKTLEHILALCPSDGRPCYLGGYSLAGLFALWAAYQTGAFYGIAAASPSVWFPGFTDYMRENPINCRSVYLSLGDREEKARNPLLASSGTCIREAYSILTESGIGCTLEWNRGGHFADAAKRTAAAFSWLLGRPFS